MQVFVQVRKFTTSTTNEIFFSVHLRSSAFICVRKPFAD